MSTQQALALPSPAPSNTVVINARCSLRIEADQRVIVVAELPVHHYRAEDAVAEAGVGVLLALPCLVESGLFRISRKLYGDIGPAFYGLRTTLLTLLLMALLRIKRPEHLKEKDPAAFGRLLGLDPRPGGEDAAAPAHPPGAASSGHARQHRLRRTFSTRRPR